MACLETLELIALKSPGGGCWGGSSLLLLPAALASLGDAHFMWFLGSALEHLGGKGGCWVKPACDFVKAGRGTARF